MRSKEILVSNSSLYGKYLPEIVLGEDTFKIGTELNEVYSKVFGGKFSNKCC